MARNRQRIFWLASAGIVMILAMLLSGSYRSPWTGVLEGLLYFLCLVMLYCHAPLQRLLSALPRGQQVALFGVTVILLVAQLRDRPDDTWPFLPWNMYRSRFEAPQYLEVRGITHDGRDMEIPVGEVYQSQSRTTLWRLQLLSHLMDNNHCEVKRLQRSEQFRTLLLATVGRFMDQHPGTLVQKVQVKRCTLPRPGPGRKLEISRKMYLEYPLY